MRVLVTRPETEAKATADALARLGHQAVLTPVLRIAPLDFSAPHQQFDAIIFTSANAVRPGLPYASGVPIYVVGARAASALIDHGYNPPHHVAADSKGLMQAIGQAWPSSAKVLYIAGRDRKSDLEAFLKGLGHHVTVLIAYEAIAAEDFPTSVREDLAAGGIEAVLHFSRRSAGIFVAMMTAAGLVAQLRHMRHLCLSKDVAVPLEQVDAADISIAAQPDEAHLLALLDG